MKKLSALRFALAIPLFGLFCFIASSDAFAQGCNSQSGFIKSRGTFTIGDLAAFGPDCETIMDSGVFGATYLGSYPGANPDQQLDNAIAAGALYIQLQSNTVFSISHTLPRRFTLNCNGFFVNQGASVTQLFLLKANVSIENCWLNGNGTLFTGDMIRVPVDPGNDAGQLLFNVNIVNTAGYNIRFEAGAGGNFVMEAGSLNRTVFTNPAVVTVSEPQVTGPRFFHNVSLNGAWGYDIGGHYTVISGGSMLCLNISSTASYTQIIGGTRIACAITVLGSNGLYYGVFDAGLTLGLNAQFNVIYQQPGLTVTDNSTFNNNTIIPACGNTWCQYMVSDGQIGWELFAGNNARMTMGSLSGGSGSIPYIRSQNSLGLNIGDNSTDYWHFDTTGGLFSIGVTGGNKGIGTINMAGCFVNNVACVASASPVTGVSNVDGTLTISPTTGAVIASLALSHANTWAGVQSFNDGAALVKGLTSGTLQLRAAAIAGSSVLRFPNGSTDFTATGGASQVVKQASAGGAFTVGQLACSDLSGVGSGCSGAASAVGANPTTSVGLAIVNGAASTFMRSDAAPALSQGITPTWTGQHIFSTSGIPAVINSTNSAQNIQMQAAGVTTAFFGGAAGAPLFVQNPSGVNVVAFNFAGTVAASPSMTAQATTLPVIYGAAGSDTNIDVQLAPKGTGRIQLGNASSFSANAAVATVLTAVGPTGASTTVQEWLTVKNSAGTVRYIPAF